MKKPSPPIPASVRKVAAFVDEGGSVPSEKPAAATKDVSGYMLRMPTPLLKELTALRDQRKAEQKAKGGRVKELLSVHSLILEAVEDLLKKEKRRSIKDTTKKDTAE
ncbi:hypothetical protein GCM10027422_47560 [Hymenobacter arcticus]